MPDFADLKSRRTGSALLGTVASVPASGACAINLHGLIITARVAVNLTLVVGDKVMLSKIGSTYVVVCEVNPAPAIPASAAVVDIPIVDGDPSPNPQSGTATGLLICTPTSTASYRDAVWRTDLGPVDSADTYQGRYSGSAAGRSTGVAFYGTKPGTLTGATVTAASVRLRRLVGGDAAAKTATLWAVTETARPAGAPTLNETSAGPTLAPGATADGFAIPTAWAQAMANGTRGGLAISVASDSPYIRLAGRGSWSAAWTLSIAWRRG